MTKLLATFIAAAFALCTISIVTNTSASAQSNKGDYCQKHWKPGVRSSAFSVFGEGPLADLSARELPLCRSARSCDAMKKVLACVIVIVSLTVPTKYAEAQSSRRDICVNGGRCPVGTCAKFGGGWACKVWKCSASNCRR